jgi:23S rRNA (adenine2503-C2)-methyltransferase
MKIIKNVSVPTGNIIIGEGEKGLIEFLSIGDYGKEKNIKADFLGLKREINSVPHGDLMPLSEKWVITISSQYGCSMGCHFCDVPKVGKGRNATKKDLDDQIIEALKLHPEIISTKRLNIHYARMGEPTFNFNILESAIQLHKTVKPYIGNSMIHPVVSTMMPKKNKLLIQFLNEWIDIKNYVYRGDAGLQLSINSTDDEQREEMFNGSAIDLEKISDICAKLEPPKGRKYTLNFAIADTYKLNAKKLSSLFDVENWLVKLTPIHNTESCKDNYIKTSHGYDIYEAYKEKEDLLKFYGFDVIVFVPSKEEDESMITCGNAILSHSNIHATGKEGG